ncbi:hypothetical protein BD410DRAFT_903327 [Rickenella mellea]|uniref:SET domain-containing protein n=1 Tax=Rickenella mellea TaxID=50990 RepID=A0A4Y7PES4_9AGAM|nr:hypothetical protein BD410DRAFT_903327 [Rickenella mellea]
MGTILAIREPTYKLSAMNSLPVLLVDSPSDIVFLDSDNSILRRQTWGSATIGRTPTPHTSAEAWRASGVTHFRAKRWLAAAVCFSNGIKLDPNEFILRLNRSEVYIRMGWYKSAFQDAEKVLLAGNNVDDVYLRKAVFRAAKSLYHLGEYNMAIDMANRRQRDDECQTWYTKASDRLHEQLSGEYDWNSLFQQSQASFEQVEMAEFTGPVQVRDVNGVGGGRGIFVNRDVKAGELLMVSKAIATGSGNPQHDQSTTFINCITNDVLPTRTAAMRSQLIERLWEDSRVDLIVQALYAGSDCPPPSSYQPLPTLDNSKLLEHPLRPSTDIDITRLDRACTFNGIGLDPIKSIIARSKNDFDPELDCVSGIFSLPSLCNHSCLPSAHWSSFGKFICIRANRNLRKDDEVTIQYFSVHASFENRTQNALHWGFTCHCVLCEMDRADGEKACKEREEALSLLRQDFDVDYDDGVMQRALKLADDVRRTYRDHEKRGQCNVKPARFIAHDYLAALYTERILTEGIQFFKPSIEEGMKAIEAVGVVILDKSISGKVNCESSLPIDTTRGPTHMKDECLRAVLHIVVKFYTLGELRRAELWLKTAVYLEDIHIGGGWQLFQSRHHMLLQEIGLTKFARFIFS